MGELNRARLRAQADDDRQKKELRSRTESSKRARLWDQIASKTDGVVRDRAVTEAAKARKGGGAR